MTIRKLLLVVIAVFTSAAAERQNAVYLEAARSKLTFCHLTRTASSKTGLSFLNFLSRPVSGHFGALVLYQSTWDKSHRLQECVSTDDPVLTKTFLSYCQEGLQTNSTFTNRPDILQDARSLVDPPARVSAVLCQRMAPNLPGERGGLRRLENRYTPPLRRGVFDQADLCCREHDHCKETISVFKIKYGIFNHHLYTLSHCECDQRFRQCLIGVNDTVANLVGYGFFNVIKVSCFVFQPKVQCTRVYWWGGCKKKQKAPFAVLRPPTSYNATHPAEEETDMGWRPKPKSKSGTKGSQRASPKTSSTTEPPSGGKQAPKPPHTTAPDHKRKQKQGNRGQNQDKSQSCNCYKCLDQCKHKISPHEERFQLQNTEAKTLYHCNCTRRPAHRLRRMREPNAVESLLYSFVSLSCFDQEREECDQEGWCTTQQTAVLSMARHLRRVLKTRRSAEGREGVEGALKVKSQATSTPRLVPLYDRCLKMVDSRLKPELLTE
ncbi:UNVERIFIED_CONTAM: hypothetical protein FKN15_001163 [Acipenser sinensis]